MRVLDVLVGGLNPVDTRNRYTGLSIFARIPRNGYTGIYSYMFVCIYAGERRDVTKFVWGGRGERVKTPCPIAGYMSGLAPCMAAYTGKLDT